MSDSADELKYPGDDPDSLGEVGFRTFWLRISAGLELHIGIGDPEHLREIESGGAFRGSVERGEKPELQGSAELYGLHGGYEGDAPWEDEAFELRDHVGNIHPPVRTCHVTIKQGQAVELRAGYDKPGWPAKYVGRLRCINGAAPKAEDFFCDLLLPKYSFEKVIEIACGPAPCQMEIPIKSPDIACRGWDTRVWHLGQRPALRFSSLRLSFTRRKR